MPLVTVVMPVYNSAKYLSESIESVLQQTLEDWEMLIINEYGSDDGSADIVCEYSKRDSRVRLIQNNSRLGLAESINLGIRMAKGKYIARLDADDLAHKERFEKQVTFMEQFPNVGICGTYQHHFGPDIDWIHKPAISPEQCKANLLFFCDLCHSTLMWRRSTFIENNLWYDNRYLAEDFELWTRVAGVCDIANIPEVLGEYRWGQDNITVEKKERLHEESGKIVAKNLENNLHLTLNEEEASLFNNWHNPLEGLSRQEKDIKYKQLEEILRKIYIKNQSIGYFDDQSLLNVIGAKWRWIKYFTPFNKIVQVKDINEVFKEQGHTLFLKRFYYFWVDNKGIKNKWRKIKNKLFNS